MKKTLFILLLISTTLVSARNYSNDSYRYAPVVDVKPVYDSYAVPERERVCERRRYRDDHYAHRNDRRGNAGGAVLGAVLGGVLGSQIGSGSGRDAATAVGVLTGAAIGANSKKSRRHSRGHHGERYCYMKTEYRNEQRVVGYEVAYEYQNEIFYTTMDHHPGDRVRIQVNHTVAH